MIIDIQGLSKIYGTKQIFDYINYAIEKPEIIGLVAPNGYGKTTLFDIMTNIEKPTSGSINIFGKENTDYTIFNDVSYLQDNRVLYENLNAIEHLLFVAKEHKKTRKDVNELIIRLGMESYGAKKVRQYSLGMKQHLLLAIALISEPKLLLLDEPLNGLDPSSCLLFRKIMLELHESGVTIIISSHNLEEIEKLTSHVLFLSECDLISSELIKADDELLADEQEYIFILEDIVQLTPHLEKKQVVFEKINKSKISVCLTNKQKKWFDKICLVNEIKIFDTHEQMSKIQRLYFKLY